MKKKLVAFFSPTGTTAAVAQKIALAAQADLFEIVPAQPYTAADLDWRDAQSRSSVEMHNPKSRPELGQQTCHVTDYAIIFLGFPIWWYTAPTIINTFLESCDYTGRVIVPFATSGGSGFGKTYDSLSASAPGAIIHPGKLLNAATDKTISDWLATLGI